MGNFFFFYWFSGSQVFYDPMSSLLLLEMFSVENASSHRLHWIPGQVVNRSIWWQHSSFYLTGEASQLSMICCHLLCFLKFSTIENASSHWLHGIPGQVVNWFIWWQLLLSDWWSKTQCYLPDSSVLWDIQRYTPAFLEKLLLKIYYYVWCPLGHTKMYQIFFK